MAAQSIYLTMKGVAAARKRYNAAMGFTETTSPGQDVTNIMGFLHRGKWHLCCWAWKLALVVPAIHIVLHFLGVPHPEFLSFIP
jgi:hypothetical protein